jgi:hypothetical protein
VNFRDKLAKTGPRKLLALDGGGIRGMITIRGTGKARRTAARPIQPERKFRSGRLL